MSGTFDVIKLHHFNVSVPTIIMGETPALIRGRGGGDIHTFVFCLTNFF